LINEDIVKYSYFDFKKMSVQQIWIKLNTSHFAAVNFSYLMSTFSGVLTPFRQELLIQRRGPLS